MPQRMVYYGLVMRLWILPAVVADQFISVHLLSICKALFCVIISLIIGAKCVNGIAANFSFLTPHYVSNDTHACLEW